MAKTKKKEETEERPTECRYCFEKLPEGNKSGLCLLHEKKFAKK